MSVADKLEKLTTDITSAYDVIEGKGGTIPEHKNTENLAPAIESIQSGGTLPQPNYGRIWYGDYNWVVESAEECTVGVDVEKFTEYLETNPIMDMGGEQRANFDYNTEGQTWQSWDFENPVEGLTTEQMAEQLGITVVVNSGAEWAMFSLSSSPDFSDLKYTEFQSLEEYNSFADGENEPIRINGGTLERQQIRKYEFGGVPTAVPDYCLSNCDKLVSITEVPEGVVSIGDDFLRYSGSSPDGVGRVLLPSTLKTIGDRFLAGPAVTKYPVNIPEGVTSIGASSMSQNNAGGIFNQPISFPSSVTSMGSGFCNNSIGYNQMLIIPSNLTELDGWFNTMLLFNQPIYIPQTITKIKDSFVNFGRMTSTIYVGNLSPNIVEENSRNDFLTSNSASVPAYTQGITIIGGNRQAWLEAFPNRDWSSRPLIRGRKLIDGGY